MARSMDRAAAPFRWDVASPELARALGRGLRASVPRVHRRDVFSCAVDILRASGDSDLVFVGRSLESVYDFARGALARTRLADRVRLLQLSLGDDASSLRLE